MTRGKNHDQNTEKNTEKHMGGCIAGFFHIFDRNHVASSKRLFPKRIPHTSDDFESTSSVGSPAISREFDRSNPCSKASPDHLLSLRDVSARSSIAVSSFDFKEGLKSPSKFTRELPRLSLDSLLHPRGIKTKVGGVIRYDDSIDEGSETQRRSPSVVARLMGLEPLLPSSNSGGGDLSEKVELRRSASESRSKDLLHCRRVEEKVLRSNSAFATSAEITEKTNSGRRFSNCNGNVPARTGNSRPVLHPEPAMRSRRMIGQQQRKGLCDYGDFFPEPSVEKRLKMRGVEEPSKDLDNLKQIIDSLQFKGLLHHSKPPASRIGRRNIIYNRSSPYEESPIVVVKPVRSPRRLSTEHSPSRFQSKTSPRRNLNSAGIDKFSSPTPRSNPATSGRNESRSRSPVTTRRRNPLNIEKQRRVSPIQSPRTGSRRLNQTASQSPRRRKSATEIRQGREEDESSIISDIEKPKVEESYKDGRSLIERCSNLLNSVEEMSSTSKNSTESQLSPVSVLDSSVYKEDESPSPVMKRAIDIKDMEDEIWSQTRGQEDPNFAYMSKIIKATKNFQCHTDIFSMLEKEQFFTARDNSNSSILQRRLIFDTITEIIDRNKQLSSSKLVSCESEISQIWSELQSLQKRDESEDMFEVIGGVVKRDLAGDSVNGWGESRLELSEVVIDVERLIFRDLIGETIRDLMGSSTESRRKLVF